MTVDFVRALRDTKDYACPNRVTSLATDSLWTVKRGFSFLLARAIVFLLAVYLCACGTGRPPVPPGEIPRAPVVTPEDEQYGQQVLSQLTAKYPLNQNDSYINRCREIVARLAKAARADRALWHVYVLQGDDVANAAATRGNHVFVWTGMLQLVSSDGELATVLAHELGHVLAGHTLPTPTEEAASIMAEVSGQVVSGVLSQTPYGPLADLAGLLIQSAITAIAVNPGSQANETEADHIGFFLMADAGFDPSAALSLWSKMAQNSSSGTLSFLSSHPTSESRLEDLKKLLPEAEFRYQQTAQRGLTKKQDTTKGRDLPPSNSSSQHQLPSPQSLPPRLGDQGVSANRKERNTTPPHETWRVVDPSAEIRTDPDPNAPIITTLQKGTSVETEFRLGGWYKTNSPSIGFIRGESLTPE